MEIQQIRNATIIVTYCDMRILVDPWLGPKGYMPGFDPALHPEVRQPRVELPFDIKDIVKDIDAVLLTHHHPDHWDEYAADALRKDILFFVQSEHDMKVIQGFGFTNVRIVTESGVTLGKMTLCKTGCQHGSREIIKPIWDSMNVPYDSMGVVFKAEGEKTLYVAGDTIWCDEVKCAIDRHSPNVIVVNACGAMLANGEKIIMDDNDVKAISNYAPTSMVIASHMGTVSHLSVTREDIKELGLKNVVVPNDGEIVKP